MTLTAKRKVQFSNSILSKLTSKIGFADVGSGGELKLPWSLLPPEQIHKFDFDPEQFRSQGLPLCISNQMGQYPFYITEDTRASSLHKASSAFIARFNQPGLCTKETILVRCTTLDDYFSSSFAGVDLLDINTEGHDYQVLQGTNQLFTKGFIKCVKIEFELTEVWHGQGWFSDIDAWLRSREYDLAHIEFEFARPASVKSVFHRGEPLWGKAIYVPSFTQWQYQQTQLEPIAYKEAVLKSITLYTLLDIPGRAVDLLNQVAGSVDLTPFNPIELTSSIKAVFKYAGMDAIQAKLAGWAHRILP